MERESVGMGSNGNSINLLHIFAAPFLFFVFCVVMVLYIRDDTSLLYLRSACYWDWLHSSISILIFFPLPSKKCIIYVSV